MGQPKATSHGDIELLQKRIDQTNDMNLFQGLGKDAQLRLRSSLELVDNKASKIYDAPLGAPVRQPTIQTTSQQRQQLQSCVGEEMKREDQLLGREKT